MPRIEATRTIPVTPDIAFAVSQTHGDVRLQWDPFVRRQRLIGGERPGAGVQTETTSRHRLTMVSEYTSFRPPERVGMKMVEGPWFFGSFGGGWLFRASDDAEQSTVATWRYSFTARPAWLRPLADRVGVWLLQRDIDARIDAYAQACVDPTVVAAALQQAGETS